MDHIIYVDNNLPQVGQKVGLGPSLEGCVYTTPFEDWTYF